MALSESKLEQQISAAQDKCLSLEKRLTETQAEAKTEREALRQQLEILNQQHHEAEKQRETAQADVRSLTKQQEDLRNRLQQIDIQLQDERKEVSRLKDELAQEGKKAKALETSEKEAREQQQELRERLQMIDNALQEERKEVNRLKDELAQEGKKSKALETGEKEAREQLIEHKSKLREQIEAYSQLQQRYQDLSNEHTELKTTLERREEHFKEQMAQLSETKQSLTKEFENLANKIFEEKGKTFTHTSQASIDNMLKPFREQIEGFQKRINEVHDASIQGNTSLNAEIKKVLDIGLQMSKEANNLTSALKGDSQQRGAWGEAQLCRTLEMSGLIEDAHYEVQSSFKDAEGKNKQTDYLIKLPDGKHIIIDSKVSLLAYDRSVSAESPEEYQLAMVEHVKAVRKHIDDLASKDYTNLVGMRSPSFVLMFMPIEPAYIEALKNNKDLFEYGYKKNIVLVSHTTLIPILRTVSNLWMIERSNAEAREIGEKAGEIYNQVCTVAERLSKLGGTLNTASNHYNNTVKALAGQQGLYGKIDRFSQLSAKVSKSLPQLEPAHMDFETERLSLIIEPIEEEDQALQPVLAEAEDETGDENEFLTIEQEK
ncbi:MAG: DNA recombination protein RmuC [Methylobacter sp.]|uniref:DNA recombination protein RmuC n=1 Tax=Methylobacter sp. TaxID=2051955 RepID=UPI0025F1F23F|nr:DNA recombination protein RmuC [Methylobacter sp.]MCK9619138.1 DNA recombination protein RmuC [Methylobacter sp.]